MKRFFLSLLGICLGLAALGFYEHYPRAEEGGKTGQMAIAGRGKNSHPGKSGRTERRVRVSDEESLRSFRALRAILKNPVREIPDYVQLERLARALTEEDLKNLPDEIGMSESQGSAGWVRCALFAEWGRRDAAAAMAYHAEVEKFVMEQGRRGEGSRFRTQWELQAFDQSLYAIHYGWAKVDVEGALASLDKPEVTERVTGVVGAAVFVDGWLQEALMLLDDPEYDRLPLIQGLLDADPTRLPELVVLLDDPEEQAAAIHEASLGLALYYPERTLYPFSGTTVKPVDGFEQAAAVRAALKLVEIDEDDRRRIEQNIEKSAFAVDPERARFE